MKLHTLILTTIILTSTLSRGAIYTYNLGVDFDPTSTISHTIGTLTTNQIGTYTTESNIEVFLNSSIFTIEAFSGATSLFVLNNANTTWDLQFGGSSATAMVMNSPSELIIDFNTPSEISSATLFVGDVFNGYFQLVQGNNISNFNFIGADKDAMPSDNSLPYDTSFRFVSVPEPSVSSYSLLAILALLVRKRESS